MDIFDQYLFKELTEQYAKPSLSANNYEELFMRFENLDYFSGVRPYLLIMRFFGLGTTADKDLVLAELKATLNSNDNILKGLYYDLLLSLNENNTDAVVNLRRMVEEGYTNVFTEEKANTPVKSSDSRINLSGHRDRRKNYI